MILCFITMSGFDGKGYPDGLKGAEISVGARIIAICDSIDAMTSTRRYRKALGFDICYQEIKEFRKNV